MEFFKALTSSIKYFEVATWDDKDIACVVPACSRDHLGRIFVDGQIETLPVGLRVELYPSTSFASPNAAERYGISSNEEYTSAIHTNFYSNGDKYAGPVIFSPGSGAYISDVIDCLSGMYPGIERAGTDAELKKVEEVLNASGGADS